MEEIRSNFRVVAYIISPWGLLARIRAQERVAPFSPTGDTIAREFCVVAGLFSAAREMHRRGLGHRQLRVIERVLERSRRERHRACVACDRRIPARVI